MVRHIVLFILGCGYLAAFQIAAIAQTPPFSQFRTNCVVPISGEPSKLVEAIHSNDFNEFKRLISTDEDLNAIHYEYETPIMAAVLYRRVDFLRELIAAGADPNKTNSYGITALMNSAGRGYKEMTEILLKAGARVNDEDKDGSTALMRAARDGDLETVELLLQAGANLHQKDKAGKTAFLLSAEGGQAKTMERLLSLGFDPNSYNNWGSTALAAAARHPEMLKTLISAGAKVNLQIPSGATKSMTALEIAAQNGWTESVRVLIDAGADPNLFYSPGSMPLDKAVRKGYTEIIEMLNKAGAKKWEQIRKELELDN